MSNTGRTGSTHAGPPAWGHEADNLITETLNCDDGTRSGEATARRGDGGPALNNLQTLHNTTHSTYTCESREANEQVVRNQKFAWFLIFLPRPKGEVPCWCRAEGRRRSYRVRSKRTRRPHASTHCRIRESRRHP